MLRTFFLY